MCFRFYPSKRQFGLSEDMAAKELVRGSRQIDCLMKLNRFRRYFMSLSLAWKSSLGVNKIPNS